MPKIDLIDVEWFAGQANIAHDPDAKRQLAELIIELQEAVNEFAVSCPAPTPSDIGFALFAESDGVGGARGVWKQIEAGDVQPAFDITGFSIVGGGVAEVGETVTNPAFTAAYNRPPTSATLKDDQGNPDKDVSATPNAFASDHSFVKVANNAAVVFTLEAAEGAATDSRTATHRWRPRIYWGEAVPPGLYNEAFIEALPNWFLAANRNTTMNLNVGALEKAYWCAPASYGAPTFHLGPFTGGFTRVAANVPVTNVHGVIENYDVWESDNFGIGAVVITVD